MTTVRMFFRVSSILALVIASVFSYQPLLGSSNAQSSAGGSSLASVGASGTVSTAQFVSVEGSAVAETSGAFRASGKPRRVNRQAAVSEGTLRAMKAAIAADRAAPAGQARNLEGLGVEPEMTPGPGAPVGFFAPGLHMDESGNLRPPDTNVAASPDRVVEVVNTAIRMWDRGVTNVVIGTTSLNAFFGAGSPFVFDPWIVYDRIGPNQRFYVLALRGSGTLSEIHLAISRTPNPSDFGTGPTGWCKYVTSGHRDLGTPNASWADYDRIGIGEDKGVITTNQFRISNNTFTFAIIRVFNKLIASNNAAGCPSPIPLTAFQPSPTAGNGAVFTLVPALQYAAAADLLGCSNPVYTVNTTFGTSALYHVRAVCNLAPVTFLGPASVVGATYSVPPDSPQPGSPPLLDTGDNRVTQVQGRTSSPVQIELSTVHGTGCNFTPSTPPEACVRHLRIAVTGILGFVTIPDQVTFCFGDNTFCYWPGTAINRIGNMVVGWQRSGPVTFLTAQYIAKLASGAFTGSVHTIATGICRLALGLPVERTGDYFGAHTDPLDFGGPGGGSFVVAGEKAVPLSGICKWQTNILHERIEFPDADGGLSPAASSR